MPINVNMSATKLRYYLIFSTCVAGLCSLMYELLIGTVSSFFLGDSVFQFSMTIGIYLAAMGLGSYLSRFGSGKPAFTFVMVELILGVLGSLSVPLLYYLFTIVPVAHFNIVVFGMVMLIGMLTGFEIPLLTELLNNSSLSKNNLSDVLTYDYLGALLSTFCYPFFFLPFVGSFRTSVIFGSINLLVGLLTGLLFREEIRRATKIPFITLFSFFLVLNIGILSASAWLMSTWRASLFINPVVYNKHSNYQDITLTHGNFTNLYLDGVIQFSAKDEYRYHESLVHIPFLGMKKPVKNVLILGGGEGLAAREVLRYASVEQIDLVELDPEVIAISNKMASLKALNQSSLEDERVDVIIQDAFTFLLGTQKKYDLIIADLPDPSNESLARLYSDLFFSKVRQALDTNGIFVTQATNPSLNTGTFWCIEKTLKSVGFQNTSPYRVYVPSFGEWGFIMASNESIQLRGTLPDKLQFLSEAYLPAMFNFSKDILAKQSTVSVNNIDKLQVLQYFLEEIAIISSGEKKR